MSKNSEEERTLTEPEKVLDEFFLQQDDIEQEKKRVRERLGFPTSDEEQEETTDLYTDLKTQMYRAGIRRNPEFLVRLIFYSSLVIVTIASIFVGAALVQQGQIWWFVGTIILAIYTVGFAFVGFGLYEIAKLYLDYRRYKRKEEIEKVLPEYLRMVATNIRSGLPLDKALVSTSKQRFGILMTEIEDLVKTLKVKGDFAKGLEIFGRKYDSDILRKSMNSIASSVRSGSNISELLEKIADNITKMRNMVAKLAASVKNYIIFIVVSGTIIAPLMFAMSFHLNMSVSNLKSRLTESGLDSGVGFIDEPFVSEVGGVEPLFFDVFSILMILSISVVSSVLISVIRRGNWRPGIKRIPLYVIVSLSLYYAGKYLLDFISISV